MNTLRSLKLKTDEYLGIESNLDWVKPPAEDGSPQGHYITTTCGRFTISKNEDKQLNAVTYSAWDRKKISAVYGPSKHNNDDGKAIHCQLESSDNGFLGNFYFRQEAVNVCEIQLESMESI